MIVVLNTTLCYCVIDHAMLLISLDAALQGNTYQHAVCMHEITQYMKYMTSRNWGWREVLKELSHGSPLMHWKIDNYIHNVLCQQLAQRQDYAGPYVVHTYIAQ